MTVLVIILLSPHYQVGVAPPVGSSGPLKNARNLLKTRIGNLQKAEDEEEIEAEEIEEIEEPEPEEPDTDLIEEIEEPLPNQPMNKLRGVWAR